MKRFIFLILITCLLAVPLSFYCSAVESASIGGNDITISESIQTVPVFISHNPGIMGYKIMIEYPDGVQISSVARGTICQKGNFNTNLENHLGNKISVVWNNTENVSGDGSLFVLSLTAKKEAKNKELKITYSKEDTFNENWQDVALFCTGLSFVDSGITDQTTMINESISDKDYDYIKTIIGNELNNLNVQSIDEIKKENVDSFVDGIKSKLPDLQIESIDDIKGLYVDSIKNGIISTTETLIDKQTIADEIKEILNEANVKNIDEINAEKTSEINSLFAQKVLKDEIDLQDEFGSLDEASKLEVIKSVYADVTENESPKSYKWIWIVSVLIIVITLSVAILIIKRKKGVRKNEEDIVGSISSDSDSV